MILNVTDESGTVTGPHMPGVIDGRLAVRVMGGKESAPAAPMLTCGTCSSGQIQRVKEIYETGASIPAPSGAVAAARCAPPEWEDYKPQDFTGILLYISIVLAMAVCFATLTGVTAAAWGLGSILLLVIVVGVAQAPSEKTKRQCEARFQAALADWNNQYFCHQCGSTGKPVKVE